MHSFTFSTTQTLIHQAGASQQLAQQCQRLGARSVTLITDPGLLKTGLLDPILAGFSRQGVRLELFAQVEPDPSESTVLGAVARAREAGSELVVGFGGGSSMDVAKLVAVLAHPDCSQSLESIYGVELISGPRLPLIQVPTTAGTGSEVTPIAIVTRDQAIKSGVVSARLLPDIALLDAELTLGLPPQITASTGIDAMVHAIEAYTSRLRKNPLSDLLAREALRLLSRSLPRAVADGSDLEARSDMLLGAMLAGQAFANAPVAAVHALAYPLGGHFHIPHGLSNSLVLTEVLGFNAPLCQPAYAELARILLPPAEQDADEATLCQRLIDYLEQLINDLGLPTRLRELGVDEASLPLLARDAMQQQRLLVNNPRELVEADALAIYRAIY